MTASVTKSCILDEPGFEYVLCPWGDLITGTPEQLQRIGIGRDIQFPECADGRWRRKCIDPRGFEVILRHDYCGDGYIAVINFPGREFDDGVVAKPFAFGVELREEPYGNAYVGTADALVAAGIVPAGYFPGWPGMAKTTVNICPDGTIERLCNKAKEPEGRYVTQKSKGQRPTYECVVKLPWEITEERRQDKQARYSDYKRRMNALPRPAPLIDHPDYRCIETVRLVPKYRVDGNIIYLAPRCEWRAGSC